MSVELWKTIFDWAAVWLVGLTFIAGAGALITGRILSERQASELRQLQIDLAKAQEEVAQADMKRLDLRNRILDIFGPRELTAAQSARIVAALANMRSAKIDVYVFAVGHPSAADFENSLAVARTIVQILWAAHMDAGGWLLESCQNNGASNVVVGISGDNGDDLTIATRLLRVFEPEIVTDPEVQKYVSPAAWCAKVSDLDPARPNRRKPGAAISITIGAKIQPILTPEMLELNDLRKNP